MVTKYEQGHYYKIELSGKYKEKGPYFVQVNAITRKESIEIYGAFDIRSTFFDNDGILTYLNLVAEDTDILICNIINGIEPIEIDKENIFLPTSILDLNSSEEYFISNRYVLNIQGIDRRFDRPKDQYEWENSIEETIKTSLAETNQFVTDLLSTEYTSTEFLKSSKSINDENVERDKKIKERDIRNYNLEKQREEERLYINEENKKLDTRKTELDQKQTLINFEYNRLLETIYSSQEFLAKVENLKTKLMDVYSIVSDEANTLGVIIPTWEEIYNSVFNT
jgi:hypothetical protein